MHPLYHAQTKRLHVPSQLPISINAPLSNGLGGIFNLEAVLFRIEIIFRAVNSGFAEIV